MLRLLTSGCRFFAPRKVFTERLQSRATRWRSRWRASLRLLASVDVFEERRDVADSCDPRLGHVLGVKREEHLLEVDRNTAGARELVEEAVRIDRSGREPARPRPPRWRRLERRAGRRVSPSRYGTRRFPSCLNMRLLTMPKRPCRWLRSLLICW